MVPPRKVLRRKYSSYCGRILVRVRVVRVLRATAVRRWWRPRVTRIFHFTTSLTDSFTYTRYSMYTQVTLVYIMLTTPSSSPPTPLYFTLLPIRSFSVSLTLNRIIPPTLHLVFSSLELIMRHRGTNGRSVPTVNPSCYPCRSLSA